MCLRQLSKKKKGGFGSSPAAWQSRFCALRGACVRKAIFCWAVFPEKSLVSAISPGLLSRRTSAALFLLSLLRSKSGNRRSIARRPMPESKRESSRTTTPDRQYPARQYPARLMLHAEGEPPQPPPVDFEDRQCMESQEVEVGDVVLSLLNQEIFISMIETFWSGNAITDFNILELNCMRRRNNCGNRISLLLQLSWFLQLTRLPLSKIQRVF